MKSNRLVSMLMLLVSRDSIPAPELAKIFGVTTRTIYRDIEELIKAGVPIIATQGRTKGMSISQEYKDTYGLCSANDIEALLMNLRNAKAFHLESDNDKLMKRFINYISEKSPENYDDISFIEIEIQFDKKHRSEIRKVFGEFMLDIESCGDECKAKLAFPDNRLYYDVLIRFADRCKFISPEHIRNYVHRRIKTMFDYQGIK